MTKKLFILFAASTAIVLNAAIPLICLPDKSTPTEKTAASELADYIQKITDSKPQIIAESANKKHEAIYIGNTVFANQNGVKTATFSPDEWLLLSKGNDLIIAGGDPRGILYAVYHYLEDCLGVRFWNHVEEKIPQNKEIPLKNINKRGEPEFLYRELCSLHLRDSGRFAAKMRLTSTRGNYYGQMNPKEPRNFGMENIFGPPNFVHTFHMYIPYKKYFKDHPEYFGLLNGKRFSKDCGPHNNAIAGTLCLSNAGLRKELLANLKQFIRQGRREADKYGFAYPRLYDVSANDNTTTCECKECIAIVKKYNAVSGLYLEVINELADGIKEEFPEVVLHTYSYLKTTDAPRGIVARKNVCVTLCDHDGNTYDSYLDKDNAFVKRLQDWNKVVPQLRTWTYGLTFAVPRCLPYPNEFKYADYMKVFRKNGVRWLMQQFESPMLVDCWDYKLWVWAKLAENPDLDTWEVVKEFAHGYYGAAGKYFLAYRKLLYEQAEKKRVYIPVYATPGAFTHLDYDTVVKADKLFADGEKAIAGNPVLLRRWRAARLGLDRAIIARARLLMSEYFMRNNKSLQGYAFDNHQIAKRIESTFKEVLAWRVANKMIMLSGDDFRFRAEKKSYRQNISETSLLPPAKFAHLKPGTYFDFPAEVAFRPGNKAVLREDRDAESGYGVFWNVKQTERMKHRDNLIFRWGMYSPAERRSWNVKTLPWAKIGWDGYKWLKLGEYKLTPDCYFFFFFNWQIQMVVGRASDPFNPDGLFEAWARVKLVGKDENNRPLEVGIDRIVLLPPSIEK